MKESDGLVYCPLCELPHRQGAVTCDGCGQVLSERPDFKAMNAEYRDRKRDVAIALSLIIGMIVVNFTLVGHVGGFVIVTAPLGWLLWSWMRCRVLRQRLERGPTA